MDGDDTPRGDRFPLVAVHVVLVLLGAALGVWGAFLVPLRLPGGVEGLADVIALATTLGLGLLAAFATRSVPAAAMPGIGWLVAALACSSLAWPPGEVVVPAKLGNDPGVGTVGTLYLLVGTAGAVVAVVLANRRRHAWEHVESVQTGTDHS